MSVIKKYISPVGALLILLLLIIVACESTETTTHLKITVPESFFFRVDFNDNDRYDSKDSMLSRSYNFRDTLLKIALSEEEKATIYKAMLDQNFFNLPLTIPLDSTKPYGYCSDEDRVTVFINGKKEAYVKFDRGGTVLDTTMARRFDVVHGLLVQILSRSEAYQKLPDSDVICL